MKKKPIHEMNKDELTVERARLIKLYEKAEKKCNGLHLNISTIDAEFLIPDLEKQYVGKYFRKRNYALLKTGSDYWWVYFKVVSINSIRHANIIKFENIKNGQVEITLKNDVMPMQSLSIGMKITKKQYNSALRTVLKRVAKKHGV